MTFWTRQPPYPVGFNPRYPRPGFCYVPTYFRYAEITRKLQGTPSGSELVVPSPAGLGYRTIRIVAQCGLIFPNGNNAVNAETWTVLGVANPLAGAAEGKWLAQEPTSGAGQMDVYFNATRSEATASGKFAAYAFNTGYSSTDTDGSPVDGAFHVWGATRNGTAVAPVLWVDGAKPAQTSTTTTQAILPGTHTVCIGDSPANATGSVSITAITTLLVCWDSVLPDAMMVELGRNPWQLFASPNRLAYVRGFSSNVRPVVMAVT